VKGEGCNHSQPVNQTNQSFGSRQLMANQHITMVYQVNHSTFIHWMMDVMSGKLQSNQTNTQFFFLQTGCPSCHPTNSARTLKGGTTAAFDNEKSFKI